MHREYLSPLRSSAAPSPYQNLAADLFDTGDRFSSTRVRLPRTPRSTSGSFPRFRHRATTTARPAMGEAVLRQACIASREATPAMSWLCGSSTSPIVSHVPQP